ncbi:uncharacterized protein N7482_004426 [Penicillium canariense]|uniref:BZIP domain-containing protein n=1 Tax=Penicillium canariense TaxID=189055 RepID=A0A9W9IAC7_9EURO|nr:uncharacterized protein N7482_004426 [Penicillium canariense]KAJ5168832.1 hypothetical protein N7482_004426 [Penicillium canariense]
MAEPLQDDAQSDHGQVPSDASAAQASYDRRREQVRQAQKWVKVTEVARIVLNHFRRHRERKENRCRMLEDELHRLYDLFTTDDELQNLHFENEILREIMARHSIPIPPGIPLQEPSLAEVTFISNGGHHQCLQVKLPDYAQWPSQPIPPNDNFPGLDTHAIVDSSSLPSQSTAPQKQSLEMRDQTNYPKGVNLAQIGVDFVLSLERPCLSHTRAPDTEEPSGHAMSMQGILLSGAPQDLHDHTVWEVPARQLEKLFELSGCLGLDGYITPVQAWNRIISRLDITRILDTRLETLRSAMIPYIKCYGFGALMEEEIFEELLETVFGEESKFHE